MLSFTYRKTQEILIYGPVSKLFPIMHLNGILLDFIPPCTWWRIPVMRTLNFRTTCYCSALKCLQAKRKKGMTAVKCFQHLVVAKHPLLHPITVGCRGQNNEELYSSIAAWKTEVYHCPTAILKLIRLTLFFKCSRVLSDMTDCLLPELLCAINWLQHQSIFHNWLFCFTVRCHAFN